MVFSSVDFLPFQQDRSNAMDELQEVERLQVIDFALQLQNVGKNGVNATGSYNKKVGTKKFKSKCVELWYYIQ